ncbi:hypothetical protein L7F22_034928 [Adiantum nelumboides]|nr:hypothetical protein [Adiantum nelumboides]
MSGPTAVVPELEIGQPHGWSSVERQVKCNERCKRERSGVWDSRRSCQREGQSSSRGRTDLGREGQGESSGGGVGGAGGAIGAAPSQQTTGRTIALMKRFLQSRWDPAALFLNLENMATDPILAEEGLKPPGTPGAHKDINRALFKLCKELFPNVSLSCLHFIRSARS